jgi:hypothetical protein
MSDRARPLRTRGDVTLNRGLLWAFYAVFGLLFASGAAWLLAGGPDPEASSGWLNDVPAALLKLHGGAAMLFLLLLGAFATQHVQALWRGRKNRRTGAVMITINSILIVTAYGLYYSGSDLLRAWASDLHIAAGLALPAIIVHHIWSGRRSRRRTAQPTT